MRAQTRCTADVFTASFPFAAYWAGIRRMDALCLFCELQVVVLYVFLPAVGAICGAVLVVYRPRPN
eukprot:7802218-Prorocentrum_lima.AAC.1